MTKIVQITWAGKPVNQDYAAAMSYLSLLYDKKTTIRLVDKLMSAAIRQFKSKDIFRASGLPLLGIGNSHVLKDKKKILSKEKLSPILLVRDSKNGKVIIADGYHRMCAVYYYDEDAVIPSRLYNLLIFVVIGAIAFDPAVSQAKANDDQNQIILLNDSASALEDSDPELSKGLTKFADEKEKEWEAQSADKNAVPTPVTDKNIGQIKDHIKLLKTAALAIQPVYPLIAQALNKMAKDMNRTIEIEK